MPKPLTLMPRAAEDAAAAADWYETERAGLGSKFRAALRACYESVEFAPESYPVVYQDFRQALLKTFPYGVYFRVLDDAVYVHRVIHHSRHPRNWQQGLN